jgi:hypothetical protein
MVSVRSKAWVCIRPVVRDRVGVRDRVMAGVRIWALYRFRVCKGLG